jgi:hypothetical protein
MLIGKTLPADKVITLGAPRDHLVGAISALPCDRRALAAARRAIIGQWSDGTALLTFDPSFTFRSRPACVGVLGFGAASPSPDSWTFGRWQLHLMNAKRQRGMRLVVLRLDQGALHVAVPTARGNERLAHIFRRQLPPA